MSDEAAEAAPHTPGGIVVGVDGSEQSLRAAHWAAAQAHRRGKRLTVVSAYSLPAFAASSMDGGYAMMDDASLRAGAEKVIEQAREFLRDYPGEVDFRIESGDPAAVMLEHSETAELLVVGSRGRGGFLGRLLGSVSSTVPAHAHCPTALVPLKFSSRSENAVTTATGAIPIVSAQPDAGPGAVAPQSLIEEGAKPIDTTDKRPVVAGMDGSDYGRIAALTAAREASDRGTTLRLVCALPPLGATLVWIPTHIEDTEALEELQSKLDDGKAWLSSHFPELTIEAEVIDGAAVDVLVEETRHAQLTVLGTRGRGGFAGMLLGSTSQGVLQHAEGPLMVVPERTDRRIEDRADFGPLM